MPANDEESGVAFGDVDEVGVRADRREEDLVIVHDGLGEASSRGAEWAGVDALGGPSDGDVGRRDHGRTGLTLDHSERPS